VCGGNCSRTRGRNATGRSNSVGGNRDTPIGDRRRWGFYSPSCLTFMRLCPLSFPRCVIFISLSFAAFLWGLCFSCWCRYGWFNRSMLVPATTAETARTAHNFLVASIRVYFRFWISRRTVETPLLRREPIIIMTINSAKYTQNDEYVAAHIPNFVIFRHTHISPANPIKPQINPCIRSFFIVRSFLDSERGTVGHNDCNSLLCFHSYTHNTPYFHQGGFRTLSH